MAITGNSSVGRFDMTGDNAIPQGATRVVELFIYQNGTIVDFSSGYTAKLQVRQGYGQPVIVELTTADTTIVLASGASSTPNVVITFSPSKTANVGVFQDLIYDLAIYKNDGNIYKYLEGNLDIRKRVTV
jgi:hypothetical protein